jgi:hypothetical protein
MVARAAYGLFALNEVKPISMMWALTKTNCRFIVEMDGDLSHSPEELGQGLALLNNGTADVVVASKYPPGSLVTNRRWSPARQPDLQFSRACRDFNQSRIHYY